MKDLAGSEAYVGYGVIPSVSTAVDGSCALEVRQRQRESSPPNQPVSRAKIECPILTKVSVVPVQPPRSLPVLTSQSLTMPKLEVAS